VTLAEAVHASTNAPIFFYAEPAQVRDRRFWDGGVGGYNNPALVAVIEAMANFPGRSADLRVLSLGCGLVLEAPVDAGAPPPLGARREGTSLSTVLRKAASAVMAEPPRAASFHAYVASGQPVPLGDAMVDTANVVRMSPCVHPVYDERGKRWVLPGGLSEADFEALRKVPPDAMRQRELDLVRKMGELWVRDAVPNQPIRMGARMRCDIGDPTFGEALAHWRRVENA
jgi:hypothetical protein